MGKPVTLNNLTDNTLCEQLLKNSEKTITVMQVTSEIAKQ